MQQNNTIRLEDYTHFDDILFEWLTEIDEADAIGTFGGDKTHRDAEKEKFLGQFVAGRELSNPDLDYTNINIDKVKEAIKHLKALKQILKSRDRKLEYSRYYEIIYSYLTPDSQQSQREVYDEAIRDLYIEKVNERLAKMLKIVAAYRIQLAKNIENPSAQEAALLRESNRFRNISEILHGKPDAEILRYTIHNLLNQAKIKAQGEDLVVTTAARDFLLAFDGTEPTFKEFMLIDPESLATFQRANKEVFPQVFNIPEPTSEDGKYTAQEIGDIFMQNILYFEGKEFTQWSLVVGEKGIAIDQKTKTVYVPDTRKMSRDKLFEMILHEICTHVAKRIEGDKSQLYLFGYGLAGYTDEGIATLRQYLNESEIKNFSGTDNYLAIGLAYGLDRNPPTPRDFKETFKLLYYYFRFKNSKSNNKYKTLDELNDKARKLAYECCIRNFQGTTGTIPGIVNTRDIDYKEDSILTTRVIAKVGTDIDKMRKISIRFNIGKFNLLNKNQFLKLLAIKAVTEEDLNLFFPEE